MKDQEMCDAKHYMISAALITSGRISLIQILRVRLIAGYSLGAGLSSQ